MVGTLLLAVIMIELKFCSCCGSICLMSDYDCSGIEHEVS